MGSQVLEPGVVGKVTGMLLEQPVKLLVQLIEVCFQDIGQQRTGPGPTTFFNDAAFPFVSLCETEQNEALLRTQVAEAVKVLKQQGLYKGAS